MACSNCNKKQKYVEQSVSQMTSPIADNSLAVNIVLFIAFSSFMIAFGWLIIPILLYNHYYIRNSDNQLKKGITKFLEYLGVSILGVAFGWLIGIIFAYAMCFPSKKTVEVTPLQNN